MATFETAAELGIEIPDSEIRSARRKIERGLGDVSLGASSDGPAARAMGGGSSAATGGQRSRRLFRWARRRTSALDQAVEHLASIEDNVGEGGGLGGFLGGAAGGGLVSKVSGSLGGLGGSLGSVGIGSLVGSAGGSTIASFLGKASLGTLVRGVSSIAALITGKEIIENLLTGDIRASDVIDPLNNLGDLLTGPLPLPDAVETVTGLGVFITGVSSITNFLTGVSLTSLVSKVGLGALLNPYTGSLVVLLGGAISLADLIDGDISDWNLPARFGKAMGAAVAEHFPSLAELIHDSMTENPVFDAGQWFGEEILGQGGQDSPFAGGPPAGAGGTQSPEVPQRLRPGNGSGAGGTQPSVNLTQDSTIEVQQPIDIQEIRDDIARERERDLDELEERLRRNLDRGGSPR